MDVVLVFTASDYIDCQNICPDEFLDLALGYQNTVPPILAPHGTIYPFINHGLITFDLKRSDFLATSLRC
jgi:hypothetical protein